MTWFDIAVLAVTVLSAVMSLGRGMVREAFSLIAFTIGVAVGATIAIFLGPQLKNIMSPNDESILPWVILFVVGFLISYIVAAFVGQRLSKLIHSSPEIGALDRIVGAIFGVARGLVAALFMLLLIEQVLPDAAMPQDIVKARTYPYFHAASTWVRSIVPDTLKTLGDLVSGDKKKESTQP